MTSDQVFVSSDQDAVVACAPGHDTKCECKAGKFCSPEEACEVCRKCSR